jgi:hypothetical protein
LLRLVLSSSYVVAGAIAVVGAAAVIRAATASSPLPPSPRAPPSEEVRRAIFREIAAAEPGLRDAAAKKFPGDAWSQDDDFHNREQESMRRLAGAYDVAFGEVLKAVDDGLRERWPGAGGMRSSVPPCRPRLDY